MAQSKLTVLQRESWKGRVYGRLTVLENLSIGQVKVLCRCECGNIKKISKSSLCYGSTVSCGCFNKEVVSRLYTTHGASKTNMYRIWAGMLNRCSNENNSSYNMYGGRGITVCAEWKNSFETFLKDMGERPTNKHKLDRINNDLGYSKGNCRWVTNTVNTNNTRRNVRLFIFGESLTVAEWSRKLNINQYTMYGWAKRKPADNIELLIKNYSKSSKKGGTP